MIKLRNNLSLIFFIPLVRPQGQRAMHQYSARHSASGKRNEALKNRKRKATHMMKFKAIILAGILCSLASGVTIADEPKLGFFITSVGLGQGANLGGLAGADAHCAALAAAVGSVDRTWRAYLSTQADGAGIKQGESARDRIGSGPWYNAMGELIATDLDQLHQAPNISQKTALNEHGGIINGREKYPNQHDILTGSKLDGTHFPPLEEGDYKSDYTCQNWTGSKLGRAQLGHHDAKGNVTSWVESHTSKGCSEGGLASTGGAGLFYCFAVD